MNKNEQLIQETTLEMIEELTNGLVGIEDDGECLFHYGDNLTVSDKSWLDWNWTQGVALYGLFKYSQTMNDQQAHKEIEKWYATLLPKAASIKKNVNAMAPILTLACLYEETGEPELLPYLIEWGEWAMTDLPKTKFHGFQHTVFTNEHPKQLWDDTLMMAVLALGKIGVLLERQDMIDEVERQFLVHSHFLMDKQTGLWFHGWTFEGNHNFGNQLWGRGNCWITIAIPEIIDILGANLSNSVRSFISDTLRYQVEALKNYQTKEGLWRTLICDSQSYIEISASLGFAYGILKACHLGLLTQEEKVIAEKAIMGVIPYIEKGKVRNVSAGTGVGKDAEFYKNIPLTDMPYGPALAILTLSEYLHELA